MVVAVVVAVSVAVVGGFVTVSSMYRKPCHVNWGTKETSSPDAMAVDMYLWEEKSQGEEGGTASVILKQVLELELELELELDISRAHLNDRLRDVQMCQM